MDLLLYHQRAVLIPSRRRKNNNSIKEIIKVKFQVSLICNFFSFPSSWHITKVSILGDISDAFFLCYRLV